MKKIVLIIDDDVINLKVVKRALDEIYDVRAAKSGKTALTALEGFVPDAIVLDVEMPEMNGFEFLEAYHERFGLGVPVVMLSAHVEGGAAGELRERMRVAGVNYCAPKPFLKETLLGKLELAIATAAEEGGNTK